MIPFNKPYTTGNEIDYIREVIGSQKFAGDGKYSRKCAEWLVQNTGCKKAILTPSGTAALEMMMILAGVGNGDEVIMPSFTFSSTANAVVLRGAVPIFVDIRHDTLNIDEKNIESAITPRTKAICPVHYAGVGCDMETIMDIARKHNLLVLEDAAQGICAKYRGRPLGSIGNMSALSFHETKNIQCGEGGALLINDPVFIERAEIVMEKGTDRSKFFRGEIDKYTWVDIGSSFLMNEITAAFLYAQLEKADEIVGERIKIWNEYHKKFENLEKIGLLHRPTVPADCEHNAHIYYVLFNTGEERDMAMEKLRENKIGGVFHYIPLETAKAGKKFCRDSQPALPISADISARLLRLPLWCGMTEE